VQNLDFVTKKTVVICRQKNKNNQSLHRNSAYSKEK